MNFLQALASTSVIYWQQPKISFAQVGFLLISNGALLILCRSASFGFGEITVDVIMTFIILFLQYIASVVSLLRGNVLIEAPKLAKTMAVVWLVSLILFLPNSINGLRWFGIINSYLVIAALHSLVAVVLLTHYSLYQLKAVPVSADDMAKDKRSAYKWAIFLFVVNTLLFKTFVLDSDTHDWILRNYEDLKNTIGCITHTLVCQT